MVGLRNCGHLGRVGDWAELAAQVGQVSLHFLNTSGAQRVAPFGGSDRRLSTNPITIGVPIENGDPIIIDMTTSMAAEGKLMVAVNRGERVPEGWIIDKSRLLRWWRAAHHRRAQGIGTVDHHRSAGRRDFHRAKLRSRRHGAAQQHAVDLHRTEGLRCRGRRRERDKRFVDWVKASPPARSGDRVLLPGEIERITRAKRLSEGIPVDDATMSSLIDAAKSVGIAADDATAMIA